MNKKEIKRIKEKQISLIENSICPNCNGLLIGLMDLDDNMECIECHEIFNVDSLLKEIQMLKFMRRR